MSSCVSTGVLVLCTKSDWHKAFAMICSLRLHNKDIPIATVSTPDVLELLAPVSNYLVEENPNLRGFAHKLELDRYSPFQKTLFIDADMIWFDDPLKLIEKLRGQPYGVRGRYVSGGTSAFGLDRAEIAQKLGVDKVVNIDGAGHAYFEKPACQEIFEEARSILGNYSVIAPGARVADEDVIAIAMTRLHYAPVEDKNIVGFCRAAIRKTITLDVTAGVCEYMDLDGDYVKPIVMHFPRDTCPWTYHRLMKEVVDGSGFALDIPWVWFALQDWFRVEILYRLGKIKRLLKI